MRWRGADHFFSEWPLLEGFPTRTIDRSETFLALRITVHSAPTGHLGRMTDSGRRLTYRGADQNGGGTTRKPDGPARYIIFNAQMNSLRRAFREIKGDPKFRLIISSFYVTIE